MNKILKSLCSLFITISALLGQTHAKEGECKLDENLNVTYTFVLAVFIDENGNENLLQLFDKNGDPIKDQNGNPVYKLKEPLTIKFHFKGSFSATHKNAAPAPKEEVDETVTKEFPEIVPADKITLAQADQIAEELLNKIKAGLLEALCKAKGCKQDEDNQG